MNRRFWVCLLIAGCTDELKYSETESNLESKTADVPVQCRSMFLSHPSVLVRKEGNSCIYSHTCTNTIEAPNRVAMQPWKTKPDCTTMIGRSCKDPGESLLDSACLDKMEAACRSVSVEVERTYEVSEGTACPGANPDQNHVCIFAVTPTDQTVSCDVPINEPTAGFPGCAAPNEASTRYLPGCENRVTSKPGNMFLAPSYDSKTDTTTWLCKWNYICDAGPPLDRSELHDGGGSQRWCINAMTPYNYDPLCTPDLLVVNKPAPAELWISQTKGGPDSWGYKGYRDQLTKMCNAAAPPGDDITKCRAANPQLEPKPMYLSCCDKPAPPPPAPPKPVVWY